MITETGISYAINIFNPAIDRVDAQDMARIVAGINGAGIALMDQEPSSEESPINQIYVDSARIMDAVDVITGLGYATDEDRDEEAE